MKIAIICVGVFTLRFRTVPPHGSSNKTRVNRAMPHHSDDDVCLVRECYRGGIVVMDVFWRQLWANMI